MLIFQKEAKNLVAHVKRLLSYHEWASEDRIKAVLKKYLLIKKKWEDFGSEKKFVLLWSHLNCKE